MSRIDKTNIQIDTSPNFESMIFEDEEENIYIEISFGLGVDPKKKITYIEILDSQYDNDKPRAEKGLTRKRLCELMHFGIKQKLYPATNKVKLEAGRLAGVKNFDQGKLENMYKKMGFKSSDKDGSNIFLMSMTDFFKWCKTTYGDDVLEAIAKKPLKKTKKNKKNKIVEKKKLLKL